MSVLLSLLFFICSLVISAKLIKRSKVLDQRLSKVEHVLSDKIINKGGEK